jgi:radical SAM superfamily enzyme YgiQ (UPF0313 family)
MRILYLPNSHCQQRQLEKPNFLAYPVRMAMEAQWYRNQGHEVYWAKEGGEYNFVFDYGDHMVLPYDKIIEQPENLPFLSLPHPDRIWTDAKNPRYQKNGNFQYHPGTYIQSASGCHWGRCSFCVENGQKYEVRPVEDVISEIEEIKSQGYKEVFDDSATFPIGNWLSEFLDKFTGGITMGCNMRMVDTDYALMAHKGFRLLLFGLESANQNTLNKINKGVDIEKGIECIKKAANAGLEPHVAVMFGYSWETDREALETLRLVHFLLRKGYAKTAQASFYSYGVGTSGEAHRRFVKQIYNVGYSPQFWFNQLKDIRDINDIKYLWRKIKAGLWQ